MSLSSRFPNGQFTTFKSFTNSSELDEFLRKAVETRLRFLVPLKSQWPRAMAIMALPQNAPTALGLLAELVDEIWAHAGDKSTDMNWYAKRLGLAYVHNLTEIYLLQDESPDQIETWSFLKDRVTDLRSCKEANLNSVVRMFAEGVKALGSVVRWI